MLRRFLQGQAPSTSGPKRPFTPRDRRRDDRLGPGSTKRAFEKTTYSVILCILHPGLLSVDSARLLRERSSPAVRPQIILPTARGDAAAATWIFRGACAAAPARPRVRRDPAGNPRSTPRRVLGRSTHWQFASRPTPESHRRSTQSPRWRRCDVPSYAVAQTSWRPEEPPAARVPGQYTQ